MTSRFLLTAALLGCTALALAQTPTAIQNVAARQQQSLDGAWSAIPDPYGHGNWSFWQDQPFTGERLQDYDYDTYSKLQVPGDWNTQQEKYYLYEGLMWYRRHFDYQPTEGHHAVLHFDAANYKAKVWVNGKEVGQHEGGYTPFEFDVTAQLKPGENSVVVRVDDTRLPDGIPTMNTDWWNYGGLTRSVRLLDLPATYVRDYQVQITDWQQPIVHGYVQLDGADVAGQTVTVTLPEIKKAVVKVVTDANGRAEFAFPKKVKPELWSTTNPRLYQVVIEAAQQPNGPTTKQPKTPSTPLDQVNDLIGFRTIETRGTEILLNGQPTFMAGVNIHEESVGEVNHRCVTLDEDRALLTLAKEMGCNMVRLAHYPHNEGMTRLADQMGILVWSEIPLYWGIDWRNERTYQLAVQQLTEMIRRDHNRASVIFWSIANETAVNPERTAFLTRLANEARRQDSTRLICAALQNMCKQIRPNVMTVEDPLHEALDVFSFNEYVGWYDGPKSWCDSLTWELPQDKPIIISEFGAGARLGRHGSADHFFTEEGAVAFYQHQFTMLGRMQGLTGTIPWVLTDFRSPHRLIPGVQDDYNRKGLYSERGEKKQVWQVVHDWNVEHTK